MEVEIRVRLARGERVGGPPVPPALRAALPGITVLSGASGGSRDRASSSPSHSHQDACVPKQSQ